MKESFGKNLTLSKDDLVTKLYTVEVCKNIDCLRTFENPIQPSIYYKA